MLEQYRSRFDRLHSAARCPWSWRHIGGQHTRRVVFGIMVHGDEVGALPGALSVMEALAAGTLTFGGTADVFIGNVAAARAGARGR